VRRVVAEFAPMMLNGRVQFEATVPAEPMHLMADALRLEQVVRNLLDNARKFTPANGVVRVTLKWRDEALELTVEDSGPGVPVHEREVVFDKFHQLRDHLTDKPTGTGLGLATSRAIIARFCGLIWCAESPLGGAAFSVLLPAFGRSNQLAAGGDVAAVDRAATLA
jgi:signal transduction histidine kinase